MAFNVLTAEFLHETKTFSVRKTALAAFEAHTFLIGNDRLATFEGTNTGVAGCLECAQKFNWHMTHAVTAHAGPSSLVTTEAFDSIGDGPMKGGQELHFGKTCVLLVDGIDILVVSEAVQMYDLQQFRSFGIDPTSKTVIGLKSMQHFRAAFEPIAEKIIICDCGALCTTDVSKLPYRKVPRPIYPLDPDMTL